MRSDFEELKRFAIADILSVSGRQKTTETVDMHINTIIDIAFLKGQQASQSKVDDLQKRVDAVNLVLEGLKNANYMNSGNKAYNSLLIEKLEQALKGGEE